MSELNEYFKAIEGLCKLGKENKNETFQLSMLSGIKNVVDGIIEGLIHEEINECKHPEQERINYSSFNKPEHWACKLCGFEYKAESDKFFKKESEE